MYFLIVLPMSTDLRYVLEYSERILGEAAAYDFLLRIGRHKRLIFSENDRRKTFFSVGDFGRRGRGGGRG